ncbi:hypothetical protein CS006_06885 [Bifidobacterium primatium]|uniref:DUF1819 domain-containing protein n=1 Tax=Bifidobacterium primatium TaxID=2045438 RepID=A0A2M9H833_9BIFI|nr:DUF1819 family protein [Bifidobacterium primatium]PJM72973.1 hypothetical protein CS006_06885 [Bifidobacterium primatium]
MAERYRLSFTVGGLLASQGVVVARVFLEQGDWSVARRIVTDDNLLGVRTLAAGKRIAGETVKRLSALSEDELRYLADEGTPSGDQAALMWVAMCRHYTLVGEFANEVLRDHYLMGIPTVTYVDYDRFVLKKAMWHPELEGLSESTAKKLRQNVFHAMFEAGLLEQRGNLIVPSLLSPEIADMLRDRPESFGFFPMGEPGL